MRFLIKGVIAEPEYFTDAGTVIESEEYKKKQTDLYKRNFDNDYAKYQLAFEKACNALGAAIVRAGHEIIVGVPHWKQLREQRTVANYIILGANDEPRKDNYDITLYTPQDPEPPDTTKQVIDTVREFNDLERITIDQRFLGRGNWSAAMIPDILEADAVILIGGGDGTASIGYAAVSFNKPVVPITWFAGAAYDISESIVFNQWISNSEQYGLDGDEISSTQNEWYIEDDEINNKRNQDTADNIVALTTKLVNKYRRLQSEARNVVRLSIGILIAFMFLWVVVFLRGSDTLRQDTTFFLLLFLASIVGTGLRTLVTYSDENKELSSLNYTALFVDFAVGLGLALGLALLYLIGGISFTGKVVVLESQPSDTFTSIAVTMSLLGLAAGFLLPVEELQRRLEGSISSQDTQEDEETNADEDNQQGS